MIEKSPKTNMEELAQQNRERHEKLRQSVLHLQESLDSLRLVIKYQAFDIEATRRENNYLRRLLEDNGREKPSDPNS